jgi:tripartite-type tricarboxylate transporter receptor subunit TctC
MHRCKLAGLARTALVAIGLLASSPGAGAQEAWPAKPIRLIVPTAAGSGTDVMARYLADRLSPVLRQPIVVDNKAGASGVIATQAMLQSPADGHTLQFSNGSFMVMAPALMQNLPFDVQRDVVPVAMIAIGGVIMSAYPGAPVKTLGELVAYVKANPDRFSYGSFGIGSSAHLITEWLIQQTGMKVAHVPYKSTPQMLADIAAGNLLFGWTDPGTPLPLIQAGKVRGIAISGNVRVPATPDVATMGEQGYRFDAVGWMGLFAPAGTPPAVLRRLNEEINRIQMRPETAAEMARRNFEPPPTKSLDEFREIVRNDLQTWREIVRRGNIKAE